MSKFLHQDDNYNNAKAIAMTWVFSKNSQAKNIIVGDFPNTTFFLRVGSTNYKTTNLKHLSINPLPDNKF